MIIKSAKYKKVKVEVPIEVSPEVYGCDNCEREIKEDKGKLDISIFVHDQDNSREQFFCCWKCLLEYLPEIKCDYFITLPYLHYDEKQKGIRVEDFLKLIKL